MSHPLFEIVTTTTGAISIRNKAVNEIMHNPVGPWAEANSLYIEQSRLQERLLNAKDEFVLFDIGLGAAANALAALACVRSIEPRAFRMISFERDLELLEFALDNAHHFAHFSGNEKAIRQLLDSGEWSDGQIIWQLRHGDFTEKIKNETHFAHAVFFDPYSPEVNKDMWTMQNFKNIRAKSHEADSGGASLYTYSQATRIRAALIAAGFFVGYGASTGLKKETTEAATTLALLREPLDLAWLDRYRRSPVRYPYDCAPEDEATVDASIYKYFSRE